MPFMDMVSNRFTLSSFNALLFLYPFCLLSTFVIGGSLLIEPKRSFAPAKHPTSMSPAGVCLYADVTMRNLNLHSKMTKSFTQRPKNGKPQPHETLCVKSSGLALKL